MTTIKDIAKLAGVAQGTVSNVLNGKGNVSSKKIKQVMDAAMELGYVPNERAKLLRKGHTNILSVILPNMHSKQYIDFYLGFKTYAETHNYNVLVQLSNDNNHEAEIAAIQQIRSYMSNGIAVFSGFQNQCDENPYTNNASLTTSEHLLFIERKVSYCDNYIGFDYELAGKELAKKALEKGYSDICLLTGSLSFSNEADFYRGFTQTINKSQCKVNHIQTDAYRKMQSILQLFNDNCPQAVFISNYEFAESVKDIYQTFHSSNKMPIYTISPLFTMPENDFVKYELNYRKLGNVAAKQLINNLENTSEEHTVILENSGFRNWEAHITSTPSPKPLNVLTLDSPSAYTLRHLAKLYTKKTDTPVHVTIYSYDEIYEAFSSMNSDSVFDVLRVDVTWLSWFAEKILQPLDAIDASVRQDLASFIPGTTEPYSFVNGRLYALPSTPSIQLLFYRKDLFESSIYKRMYLEKNKKELTVPKTFEQFNEVARFFTKSFNPSSPVDYGATLTLGSTGVASSEFLARLFSLQEHLYDKTGKVYLNSQNSKDALNALIEAKQYSNPQYCSWWTNTADAFADGNVAMSIMYSNYASNILNESSKVIGNIGFSNTPGNNPAIGGGYLGVSRFTKRPEEALSFIRWICSEPISSARTLLGSVSPCTLSYDNYRIVNDYPWLNLAKNSFVNCRGYRVPENTNHPFDERKFLNILGMAVKNAYSGAQSVEDALDNAQKMYEHNFK
ncbi:MAG: extracellular solute-binding protein [Tyzzerella sp.]|nr:extracellular solute-binding protein [Tyzzerella sp.]